MTSTAPAAGWYPDPNTPGQLRWWDGTSWTEHLSPAPGHAQAAVAATQHAAAGQWGGEVQQGVVSGGGPQASGSADPRFAHDRFVVRQWRRLTVHKYEVHVGEGPGPKFSEGPVACFVQQKRLSLKDRIMFYSDTAKTQQVLQLEAQRKLDWGGRHTLTDTVTGEAVGFLNKQLGKSAFISSTWHICDAAGNEIALVQEKSLWFALARRYGPDVLDMFPYDFVITALPGAQAHGVAPGTVLGHHKRRWGLRDTYDLDLSGDPTRMLDRRLVVGMAIGLDALQHR